MKKLLPWITALIIILVTFGAMFANEQREANHRQVLGAATGLNSSKTPDDITEWNESKAFSTYLLGCAGAVTMLTIVYLVGTMPTNRRK